MAPCTHATPNCKGMSEACLDNVANVQDSDDLKQMQGRNRAMSECEIVWTVNKERAINYGWRIGIGSGSGDVIGSLEGFLALKDSHEKQVAGSATRFSEMLEDMTMLSDALRERLNDVESEISLVKKIVAGSALGIDVSHKVKVGTPKSHRRYLALVNGTYGPMPRGTPKGLLGMTFNTTAIDGLYCVGETVAFPYKVLSQ
ncbi:carotenoid isomerase [Actinidia rufa]|uniref:Carotenoid isomerase n=1 Tax=Actinidia rufa TaxID=165716 RepID=A0A7J0GEM7_9ERIC|nr:carotenoid isomerase [Actinidia rufa]